MENFVLSFVRRIRLRRPLLNHRIGIPPPLRNGISFFVFLAWVLWIPIESHAKPLRVAVSVFAVQDIVHRIVPDIEIVTAIPPGANPHTFEPTPALIRELQSVDCFLGIHPDFDGWIGRLLSKSAGMFWFINTPESAQGSVNPHVWLSIQGAKDIARTTERIFVGLDSTRRNDAKTNLTGFLLELDSLRLEFQTLFDRLTDRRFIQWHPAWNNLAKEFGLEVTGVIERGEGREPSIREMQNLIHDAKKTGTRVIVMELNRTSRAAETLRDAIDGKIVYLDGIGDPGIPERSDYLKLMRFNAMTLAGALEETANR